MQRVKDNNADYVEPLDMLAELRKTMAISRAACAKRTDFATSTKMSPPPI